MPVNIFWFRRDLRISDNHGLNEALKSDGEVLPVFVFDENILKKLSADDKRMPFIHYYVKELDRELRKYGSSLCVKRGDPYEVFKKLIESFDISNVYTNEDYEPYAIDRDNRIRRLLESKGKKLFTFNDQLIFKPGEILKPDGRPYEIFTPFSKKWIEKYNSQYVKYYPVEEHLSNFHLHRDNNVPKLEALGFTSTFNAFPANQLPLSKISDYSLTRDYPAMDATTHLGPHLRYGTISIRRITETAKELSSTWLNELIWREFFMHILAFFPYVTQKSFKVKYDSIDWINDERMFDKWTKGLTGFPLVDAGMRELKATGFMHNRVRMVSASFLIKHLLIDWRWGEAWFAANLLDFDLSSNNGNWQWVAGCGTDAAPYFRIFNPTRQQQTFDPNFEYIRRWLPEFGTSEYPYPIVDHESARERCIKVYKKALL
jgi:deoxyribodipyrimidine photo-lyase